MGLVKFEKYVGERLQLGIKILCLTVKRATLFLQVRSLICLVLAFFSMCPNLSKGGFHRNSNNI